VELVAPRLFFFQNPLKSALWQGRSFSERPYLSPDAFGGLRLARHTRPLVQPLPCAGRGAFSAQEAEEFSG